MKGSLYILMMSIALILILIMVTAGTLVLIIHSGDYFWPRNLYLFSISDGTNYLGEIWDTRSASDSSPGQSNDFKIFRIRIANRIFYGKEFIWLSEKDIVAVTKPLTACVVEQQTGGDIFGEIVSLTIDGIHYYPGIHHFWEKLQESLIQARQNQEALQQVREMLTRLTSPLTILRKRISKVENQVISGQTQTESELKSLYREKEILQAKIQNEYQRNQAIIDSLQNLQKMRLLDIVSAEGPQKSVPLSDIFRVYHPNALGLPGKMKFFFARTWEFIFFQPRLANTKGGIFPALWGTVLLVFLMTVLVAPVGVVTALYLNEYVREGPIQRAFRTVIYSLAGIPSIIYGIFGLGFFIYSMGGMVDQLFFSHRLPTPTFGTGGIFWASLTLAMLTLPVVVVATEQGIQAVSASSKQAAYALGTSHWQFIRRIILPQATPGILTGLILAISRAAGEVAPLMLTGVVKIAPSLAVDGTFPFLHMERKFMHLGYHIFDLAYQSPYIEATRPLIFATALLLILIVISLNLMAMKFRKELRKKYTVLVF